jgi:hypothetical protein
MLANRVRLLKQGEFQMFKYEENQKLRGSVDIKVYGADGEVKDSRYIPNLVVQAGKNYIATRMIGTATSTTAVYTTSSVTSAMTHMAIGTSTTTATVNDTTLGTEVAVAGDIAAYTRAQIQSTTQSTGVVTYVATFGVNNPQRTNTSNTTAITEAAILNSSTAALAGTMLCRTTFNAVNKGNDDTLQITWTITVS